MTFIPDQIGAYSFVWLRGDITPAKPVLQNISSAGFPGVAYLLLPTKGDATELQSLSTSSTDAGADALIAAYTQLMGTLQTIVLRNMTYANFLILDFTPAERKLVYSITGYTWNLYGSFKVQYGGLSS